jgi:hypothetical protein
MIFDGEIGNQVDPQLELTYGGKRELGIGGAHYTCQIEPSLDDEMPWEEGDAFRESPEIDDPNNFDLVDIIQDKPLSSWRWDHADEIDP